jgi:four helix bundle protein
MAGYKNLEVWKKAIDLVEEIYKITKAFPDDEKYSLTSQMRRASISIPSNIAEGNRRNSQREYIRFLRISFASGAELETQMIISERLGYIQDKDIQAVNDRLEEIMKMLNGLIGSIERNISSQSS